MRKWLGIGGVLAIGVTLLAGCLSADKTILTRYDRQTDTFHCLTVYQHIRGDGDQAKGQYRPAEDLAYLQKLYDNRSHLIPMIYGSPFPGEAFGEYALLRLPEQQAAPVALGGPGEVQAQRFPIALDPMTIRPGRFFLRGPDNLCYYHEIVIPGSVMDQALVPGNTALIDALDRIVVREMERRTRMNTWWPWDDFRDELIAQTAQWIDQTLGAGGPEANWDLEMPFATDTLKQVANAASAKQLGIKREGSELALTLPMTARDVSETIKTADTFRTKILEKLRSVQPGSPEDARFIRWWQKVLPAIHFALAGPEKLQIRVDLVVLLNTFDAPSDPARQHNEEQLQRSAEMAKLAATKLPVSHDLTIDRIVADFQAGRLAENPSEKPVKPGEGLMDAK